MQEKADRLAAERMETERDHQKYVQQNAMRGNYEQEDMMWKKQKADEIAAENRMLAMLTAERKKHEMELDNRERSKAMQAQIDSGLLAEDPNATSALGANRIRTDHFRGFSDEQREQIRAEQAAQMSQRASRREAEMMQTKAEQKALRDQQRQLQIMELQQQDEERAYQMQYKAQVNEQRAEAVRLKKRQQAEKHNRGFSDGFFGKFGTSDR